MIKALVFDFDGLIIDTETPEFHVWQDIYREHGYDFPAEKWASIVGGAGHSDFDAAEHLVLLSDGRLDSTSLRDSNRIRSGELIHTLEPLPGVVDYLNAAKRLGLKLAIASSSPRTWVEPHSRRIGVYSFFDEVITREDVEPGRTKPNPDLFLKALERLGVPSEAAIVFEDSPNGVKAARRAGIYVVAVPNELTSTLSLDEANLIVSSLSEMPLPVLLDKVQ
jgi:HAD superfamily hydrolase (TIGR01509 family)